jgi:hypothetical protein
MLLMQEAVLSEVSVAERRPASYDAFLQIDS